MFKMRRLVIAASGGALCLAATPSTAAVVVTTYSGTVRGTDELGIFGVAKGNLTGAAFTATYRVDDSIGMYFQQSNQYVAYAGGNYYGGKSPSPMTATLQINGVSYDFPAPASQDYAAVLISNDNIDEDGLVYKIDGPLSSAGYRESSIYTRVTSSSNDFVHSTNLATSLDHTVKSNDFTYGYATIGAYGSTRNVFDLFVTRVAVTPISSPVPEPASWAMMIAGLALVGASMRRRSAPVTA